MLFYDNVNPVSRPDAQDPFAFLAIDDALVAEHATPDRRNMR